MGNIFYNIYFAIKTSDYFSEKLIVWYNNNKRDLPWRHTTDPYFIWLSEIILQQTRVAQGLPYYNKFVENLPTIKHFADATEDQILRLWQGLGYYSRARNMHTTAKEIAYNREGLFPANYKDLLKLKGVGPYTAAAIASFAYKEPVAVVDGNVYRVLSRYFGVHSDIASPKGVADFNQLANELIPKKSPDNYNQAIMEFGALQCVPKSPDCQNCTLNLKCFAFQSKIQSNLPVNNKKIKVTSRFFYYFIIEFEGKYFLNKRENKGIWEGLYDFYLVEQPLQVDSEILLDNLKHDDWLQKSTIHIYSQKYQHQLTHQKIFVQFIHIGLNDHLNSFYKNNKHLFYSISQIETLPKPIIIENFIKNQLL